VLLCIVVVVVYCYTDILVILQVVPCDMLFCVLCCSYFCSELLCIHYVRKNQEILIADAGAVERGTISNSKIYWNIEYIYRCLQLNTLYKFTHLMKLNRFPFVSLLSVLVSTVVTVHARMVNSLN